MYFHIGFSTENGFYSASSIDKAEYSFSHTFKFLILNANKVKKIASGNNYLIKKSDKLKCLSDLYLFESEFSYALILPRYDPSRVSISIVSPSVIKSGTRTVAPDSTVAGFSVFVAVSPLSPGSVYVTFI